MEAIQNENKQLMDDQLFRLNYLVVWAWAGYSEF
jgi:hypothetical protein